MFEVFEVDPALRASKVLREQHAARDADRYERPQVNIVDRAAGGEEVKDQRGGAASASTRRRSCTIFRRAPFTPTRRDSHLPEAYTLQSPAREAKAAASSAGALS